jgi:AcrR family transcriptional regulator
VYSRFGGKDGVVEHLFLRGFELLAAGMNDVPTTDDPIGDLFACGQSYRRFALEQSTLYSVMFDRVVPDYQPSSDALQTAGATLQQLANRLQRAMDAGLIRRADPTHAAAIVWSTCHGVVSLELKHVGPAPIDWSAVFDDATANVVKGMAI